MATEQPNKSRSRGPRNLTAAEAAIAAEVRDMIQTGGYSASSGLSLVQQLLKQALQGILEGEIQAYMDGLALPQTAPQKVDASGDGEAVEDAIEKPANKRNGYSQKTVKTLAGPITLDIPRDRNGGYQPVAIPKHARILPELERQILVMYARGASTRDITKTLKDIYGADVDPTFISRVTDSVQDTLEEWQQRDLQSVYAVAYFDALYFKIRDGVRVKNMAVHVAIGVDVRGLREVLGFWIAENEGASFWASVFSELKTRGVQDIMIAVTDGLKGMTEAIEKFFPHTMHQTCIVHMMRHSTAVVPSKDIKAVVAQLKGIYQAVNATEARKALDAFAESPLGKRYPSVARKWESVWEKIVPFFQFDPEIRRLVYTTNQIEALNRAIRKVTKTTSVYPSIDAASKQIFLAIVDFTSSWKRPSPQWAAAVSRFDLFFGQRFIDGCESYTGPTTKDYAALLFKGDDNVVDLVA